MKYYKIKIIILLKLRNLFYLLMRIFSYFIIILQNFKINTNFKEKLTF